MDTWINGAILPETKAKLNIHEEGIRYGYGLFETVRIYQGIPFALARHLNRLFRSSQVLGFEPVYPEKVVSFAATQLIKNNGIREGILRLYATPESIWLTTSSHLPYHESLYEKGYKGMIAETRRNETSLLSRLKTFNYLENILAKRKASSLNYDEAIFLNMQGHIAEGTASNIFLVKNQKLVTPGMNEGILPGITREIVLELARQNQMETMERMVLPDEIYEADEVFLTNSLMEIMPLVQLDHHPIGNGKPGILTLKLLKIYREYAYHCLNSRT